VAPFATALAVALAALIVLALSPRPPRLRGERDAASLGALVRDRRLDRLAVAHMASLGLNAVVAGLWAAALLALPRASELAAGEVTETSSVGTSLSRQTR
jgi:hypothetical protein